MGLACGCTAQAAPSLDAQLQALSGKVGIWFFYLSTCPYCARQEPILARISRDYNIAITPISLDGGATPDGIFPDYQYDRGQAAQLGVTVTPTLYLVHPSTRQAAKLAEGFRPWGDLLRRIAAVAQAVGWLDDKTLNAAVSESRTQTTAPAGGADAVLGQLRATRGVFR